MASATELTNYFGPISLCVIGVWQLVKWRTKRREKAAERATAAAALSRSDAIKNDANLRDDQREFISVLQNENREWRTQVEALRVTVAALRDEIDGLRHELAVERRAREASDAELTRRRGDPPPDP